MISNKGQDHFDPLLTINYQYGIAKLNGCLIKGRPVTSRPLSHDQRRRQIPRNSDNSYNKKNSLNSQQKRYLNSTPYVGFAQSVVPSNPCRTPARSSPMAMTMTKSLIKGKQPIIRSFIITEGTTDSMFYDCNAQHNQFVSKLNQCINKRSLTGSRDFSNNKANKEVKKSQKVQKLFYESFNNVRVKKSLESIFLSQLNTIINRNQISTKKTIRKTNTPTKQSCKSISQNRNVELMAENDSWKGENCYVSDYTDITDYVNLRNGSKKQESQENCSLLYSKIATLHNCSNIPSLKYKRRKKESMKYSSNILAHKCKNNTSKSHYVKKSLGNQQNGCCCGAKCGDSCVGRIKKLVKDGQKSMENEDIKIEDLQIFTQVGCETPRKRKISTSFYSGDKIGVGQKYMRQKSDMNELGNGGQKQKQQQYEYEYEYEYEYGYEYEQGHSSYLRRVNI